MAENIAPAKNVVNKRFLTDENSPKLVNLKRLKWGSVSSKWVQTAIKMISAGKSQLLR